MITGADVYAVITAMVPMYVAIVLGYGAVKWWRLFTSDQCAGINQLVTHFALPMLVLKFTSKNNPYDMNLGFIAADALEKIIILVGLLIWLRVWQRATLGWLITLFSLSTLPTTVIMGVPLIRAMYGDMALNLLIQIAVLQSVFWIRVLMAMHEYRAATDLVAQKFSIEDLKKKKSNESSDFSFARSGSLEATPDSPGAVLPRSASSSSDESWVTCDMPTTTQITEITEISTADEEAATDVGGAATLIPPTTPACVVAMLIGRIVFHNLIRNPTLYASIVGLIWSLIAFRWNIAMPKIVEGSLDILADAVTGMAMFGLGLSIGLQPKIITCSSMEIMIAMIAKFLIGPIITAATSFVFSLRGPFLQVSIIQAALPPNVIIFVYAKVYENHADMLGTSVIFATLISLPIVLVYYMILGL